MQSPQLRRSPCARRVTTHTSVAHLDDTPRRPYVATYDRPVRVDESWSAVVELCSQLGPVVVRRSRFAGKPALVLGRREFAHWEGPGRVDLRITAAGWRTHADVFGSDPCVSHDSARRDWLDLQLAGPVDVARLRPLFEAAVIANS